MEVKVIVAVSDGISVCEVVRMHLVVQISNIREYPNFRSGYAVKLMIAWAMSPFESVSA
jgi:hypothetical protein